MLSKKKKGYHLNYHSCLLAYIWLERNNPIVDRTLFFFFLKSSVTGLATTVLGILHKTKLNRTRNSDIIHLDQTHLPTVNNKCNENHNHKGTQHVKNRRTWNGSVYYDNHHLITVRLPCHHKMCFEQKQLQKIKTTMLINIKQLT